MQQTGVIRAFLLKHRDILLDFKRLIDAVSQSDMFDEIKFFQLLDELMKVDAVIVKK